MAREAIGDRALTPREEHLSEMLERALALVDEERARAQAARVEAAALAGIDARLARIERVLAEMSLPALAAAVAGLVTPTHPRRRRVLLQLPECEASILKALAAGPLPATQVAKVVYDTPTPSDREVSHVWRSLARLIRTGLVARGFNKTYGIADTHDVTT